jgi:hypothetical protein
MKVLSILLGVLLLGLTPSSRPADPATIVFINGNIYTANAKRPQAEAIAVKDDRIIFVGSNADAKKFQGANTRTVDLHGATVVPGLTDAHYHFIGVGQREMNLNLEGTTNLEDFLAKVKARVDQAKPGEWVTGRGWIETFWTPPVFPTRWDLDKISPNNPVFLSRADGHGAVANSAALKLGNVTKDTKDPFGGQILHDKEMASRWACCWIGHKDWSRVRFQPVRMAITIRPLCSPTSAASNSVGRRSMMPAAVLMTLIVTRDSMVNAS